MESSFNANNINFMSWPARSSDLTNMENVWGLVVCVVYSGFRQVRKVDERRAAVLEECEKLDCNYLYALVKSINKRFLDVVEASSS